MEEIQVTEWFPPEIEPVHVGVYETRREGVNCVYWRYFDGRRWGPGTQTSAANAFYLAENLKNCWAVQWLEWRGMAQPD